MKNTTVLDMAALADLYRPDSARIALAKARQDAVWRGEQPDAWPIIFSGPLAEAQEAIPAADFAAAFHDPTLMECSELRVACMLANSNSDAVPSIRGNYGTGLLLSCFGLEQEVFPDKMPWLKQHLTRAEAAALTPDDIQIRGTLAEGLAFMRLHRQHFGDRLPLLCMDTQGPLDLAHLLLGDDLFYLFYDDPPFVHHVLEVCLELDVRAHTWMKDISGERTNECHHMGGLHVPNAGIRICEDAAAIVGPEIIEEFSIPYARRLAERFGGAWVHYCGRNDALTAAVCAEPLLRGINFGHMPAGKQAHDFEADMERCLATGTVYLGIWPRGDGETARDYLKRMHRWAARGCLVPIGDPALHGANSFATVADALDFWYSL